MSHTIFPGFIPEGYFSDENIEFIRNKVAQLLKIDFKQTILFDRASVIRIMQRVLEQRLETIPKMNQRVIMYLTNEFRVHQLDTEKKLRWAEYYNEGVALYDPTAARGPDLSSVKLANRLGVPKVGDTVRFYFTF